MENKEKIGQKISELFIQTMQEMAFVDVALVDTPIVLERDSIAVKLEVIMPYSGDLVIIFNRDVAKEFALNVFGEAQLVQMEDPVTDAASEFLNVIIGKIFAAFAPDLLFELGLPQLLKNPENIDSNPYIAHHYMTPEGKDIIFYFRLDRLITAFEHHKL